VSISLSGLNSVVDMDMRGRDMGGGIWGEGCVLGLWVGL
jgi:hypothetical protein